jgi:hypothetical protein
MTVENRVLRGISGPEKNEIIGHWGTLHNKELHNSTPHQVLE